MRNERWWYRLLQVLYICLIVVLLGIVAIISVATIPEFSPYSSRYQFACNDGTRHGNFSGSDLAFNYSEFETSSNQELARLVCSRPDLNDEQANAEYKKIKLAQTEVEYSPTEARKFINGTSYKIFTYKSPEGIPATKNYKIEVLQKEYYGSWWIVASVGAGGILFTMIFASLIRAMFLYIAFKEPFFRTLFLRKKIAK